MVRATLAWTSPRRGGVLLYRMVGWTCAEAEILGVTGRGALTTAGRVLVGPASNRVDALADAVEPAMPRPVKELIMQADLTAVAPGPLLPTVAADLADMADIESAGAATVYRFSEGSIRRAFDSGLSADEMHAFLGELARGGVPQTLTYLIDDTAR
nr:helicase-associated domain-containing protein [Micromonospora sp. DSM 115978]